MPNVRLGRPPLPQEQKSDRVVLYLLPSVVAQLDAVAADDAGRRGRAVSRSATIAMLVLAAHGRLGRRAERERSR